MNSLTICFTLVIAFFGSGVLCKSRGARRKDDGGKIVGGNDTTIQSYPYQAYLLLFDGSDFYQCGGSIVSQYHVVTAAHCLARIQKIYVRIGSTDADFGGTQYETSTFYSHPFYNAETSDYDVGVIKIPSGMALDGTNARTIGMVGAGSDVSEGEDVVLTGWGATSEGGNISSTLMTVTVPAVSRSHCNELISGGITTRMFCAGTTEGGKDTCQGDSGGPAVVDGKLAGITSFGYGCARPNTPGVYSRIGNLGIRIFIAILTGA